MIARLKRKRRQRGQAAAEYVIIAAMLIIAVGAIFAGFPYVVGRFHLSIVKVLSLPLL